MVMPVGIVQHDLGHELPAVEPDLCCLLNHGPGERFALIPFGRRGANHGLRKVVHPLLQLQLVFAEIQGELGHRGYLIPG